MRITYSEFRSNLKKYLDLVSEKEEEVIVARQRGLDVKVVPVNDVRYTPDVDIRIPNENGEDILVEYNHYDKTTELAKMRIQLQSALKSIDKMMGQ